MASEPGQETAQHARSATATPLQELLRQAVEQVESEPLPDLGPEELVPMHRLLRQMADAVEGMGPGPALAGAGWRKVALATRLEARLFAAVAEGAELLDLDRADLVAVLQGFARVREQLAGALAAAGGSDPSGFGPGTVQMAHDFRSPLTSILFLVDSLRRGQGSVTTEARQRQLAIIYSATLALSTLANDVIEFTRPGQELLDLQPSRFSIRELFYSIADLVQPLSEQRGVVLRVLAPPADLRVGPPTTLGRVLLNLTTNALQSTDEGMVELTARDLGDDQVEFAVRDTGPGLDEAAQSRLFEPFVTRRDGRRAAHGYGLGLSICRKLVSAMGSELHYETAPGWGTRFYFAVHLPGPPSS